MPINDKEQGEMNNAQLDTLLEQLAKLIELTASDTAQAAQIVRDAKTSAQK